MSSLWTPSGEHPVEDDPPTGGATAPAPGAGPGPAAPPGSGADTDPDAQVDELRRQLAGAPAEVVVANHCYGLFELAAVYLSQSPPLLDQGRLAIDALACLVDGLGDRLGEAQPSLRDALAQVRVAYVQLEAAERAHREETGGPPAPNGTPG